MNSEILHIQEPVTKADIEEGLKIAQDCPEGGVIPTDAKKLQMYQDTQQESRSDELIEILLSTE